MATCAVIRGWDPPLSYRTGYCPPRNIVATVPFTKADPAATAVAQQRARDQTRYVYVQDAEPLVQLRAKLRNTLAELTAAPTLDKLDAKIWKDFQLPMADGVKPPNAKQQEEQFREFRAAFTPKKRLDRVEQAVAVAFVPFDEPRPVGQTESGKTRPGKRKRDCRLPGGSARGAAGGPRRRRATRRWHGHPR